MTTKSRVPQIRFKGFNEILSPKKLKEVVISNTYGPRFNANDYDIDGNVKTIRGTDISINGDILYNQVPIAKLDNGFINDHILQDGDLVMITTADCGLTGIFQEQQDKFICSAYAVKITLNKDLTFPNYFKYFFQTQLAKSEVNKFIRKATVSNLPASDILKITHKVPLKEEQKSIAKYFDSLYKFIEQKEKKHQKLKQFKKAMLDKMFPKNGADTPEIRFKDFSDKWEEKRLVEFSDLVHGDGDWILSEDITSNGAYKIVQLGNIGLGKYIQKDLKTVSLKTFEKLRGTPIRKGDLLINRMVDGNVNSCMFELDGSYITSVDVCWIRDNQYIHNYFLMNLLIISENQRKLLSLSSGSGRIRISKKNLFEKFNFLAPSTEEQIKIGNYFQQLDKQIDLQQKELDKLKNIKKASLDKMFV